MSVSDLGYKLGHFGGEKWVRQIISRLVYKLPTCRSEGCHGFDIKYDIFLFLFGWKGLNQTSISGSCELH